MQNGQPSAQTIAAMTAYFGVFAIVGLFFFVFTMYLYWRVAAKAGYAGALSLFMIVPFVNIIVICLFAFNEWPIERALKIARGEAGPGPYVPASPLPPTYLPPT